MRTPWTRVVALALAVTLPGELAGQQPATADVCAVRVAEQSRHQPAAYECYVDVAARSATFREATVRALRQMAEQHPDASGPAYALGTVLAMTREADARQWLEHAVERATADGDIGGTSRARASLVRLLGALQDVEGARRETDAYVDWIEAHDEPLEIARARLVAGALAYRRADYPRAEALIRAARDPIRLSGDPRLESEWLSNHAATLWALGRSDEAREAYEVQATLLDRFDLQFERAGVLANLALLSTGDERRSWATEAIALGRATGNGRAEMLGYFYLESTVPPAERVAIARRAFDVARALRDDDAISRAGRLYANALRRESPAEALRAIDDAVAAARTLIDPNEVLRNMFVRASLRWELGPHADAVAATQSLIAGIESQRADQSDALIRSRRFGQWMNAYHLLAAHLTAGTLRGETGGRGSPTPDDLALAFDVLERLRARWLLDQLELSDAQALSVDEVRREPVVALAEVQGTLDLDEAMLLYHWSADIHAAQQDGTSAYIGGWTWLVTRDQVHLFPLPEQRPLASGLLALPDILSRRDDRHDLPLRHVGTLLLDPPLAALPPGVTRLVIVADTPLARVPFAALSRRDGRPLGESYRVSLSPSASVWHAWRRRPPVPHRMGALVVGDPLQAASLATSESGVSPLPRLPGARAEVAHVTTALRPAHTLVGGRASEKRFKAQALDRYSVVHFATHAVVDRRHPDRTAVILSPEAPENGRLTIEEISGLPLRGALVVLSSCSGADGDLLQGEGLLGLTHAFLRAGATAVVASLWPVQDDEARVVARALYRALGAGQPADTALQDAQRHAREQGLPPAAWAGYVVVGDGRMTVNAHPPANHTWIWMSGVLACLGCAAHGVWRHWGQIAQRRAA
jgi:tetratricopeptide (TPR) repeat protein